MKSLLVALLAALLLPMALPAGAQEPVGTHIGDDNTQDVKVQAGGQEALAPSDAFAAADLKALDVQETPDNFVFVVTVASLAPQAEGPIEGSTQYYVYFLQHDRVYRIHMTRQVFTDKIYSGRLEGFDPGRGGYFGIMPLDVQAAPAANTLTVTVGRQALVDANGAAPHPEIPITGFHTTAQALGQNLRGSKFGVNGLAQASAYDAMPDTGNATTSLPVTFGVRQTGHARLASDTPTRASNGEATTFVFQVLATNLGAKEDTFTLTTTGATPAGWTVKLPSSQVTIPGNGTISLPVLVTTPFTHTHGSFQNFILEMTSVNDAQSVGRVQLGVRYTLPPQPAGHHSQVWFHSQAASDDPVTSAFQKTFGGSAELFVNAEENDPTDDLVDVPGDNAGTGVASGGPTQSYTWEVPLSPGLEMGLDFNLAEKGSLQVNVKSTTALPKAVLSGQLVHYAAPAAANTVGGNQERGAATYLADLVPTAPVDIQNEEKPITTDVIPR
ncbi:MAG: hypothetical protein LC620_06135, partial [Halobacteriales archaeon]|nr:hypothetical protein [Halobacteriales archaeon]